MPENTETVGNATQGAPAEPERTFTQAEMDAIIGDRLKRERAKYADYDEAKAALNELTQLKEANKTEFEKVVEERDKLAAQLEAITEKQKRADQVAKAAAENGVDADLLARMSGDVEENAAFLKEQMGQRRYPSVPDYGEANAKAGNKSTAQQFADAIDFL